MTTAGRKGPLWAREGWGDGGEAQALDGGGHEFDVARVSPPRHEHAGWTENIGQQIGGRCSIEESTHPKGCVFGSYFCCVEV